MAEKEDDEEFGDFLQGPTPHIYTNHRDEKTLPYALQNSIGTATNDQGLHIFDDNQAIFPSGSSTTINASASWQLPTNSTHPHTSSSDASLQESGELVQYNRNMISFPKWCEYNVDLLPDVYRQVLETTLVDGQISTERLHPILALSGLPRGRLAQIWSMCNTNIPGQLVKKELWVVLALIALTQNNYSTSTIDDLARCSTIPIPQFMHRKDSKDESQSHDSFDVLSIQLADSFSSDVMSTQHADSFNSDVLSAQLADSFNSDVLSAQLADSFNSDVLSAQLADSFNSDVLSAQLADSFNSDVMSTELVDPINSNLLSIQLVDPINSDLLSTQLVDPINSDLLSTQLVDPINSDLLSTQLVDPINSDLLSTQLVDPINSDLLSTQLVEPVSPDLLSIQLVDPINSDFLSTQLVDPVSSDLLSTQLIDPVSFDLLSTQIVHSISFDLLSTQLVDPANSDLLSIQMVDPANSDLLSIQMVDPANSDLLSTQIIDTVNSDLLSTQLVDPINSDLLSTQLVDPVSSDLLSTQLVDQVNFDLLSTQIIDPVNSDSQSMFITDLTNWDTASGVESKKPTSRDSLDMQSVHKNTDVCDEENGSDSSTKYDKLMTLQEPLTLVPDLADQFWIETGEEGADRYSHQWERCLVCCCQVISEANAYFSGITSASICNGVLKSARGLVYVSGLIEIYRIICRVATSMRSTAISTTELEQILKHIDLAWNNLTAFLAGASLLPKPDYLVFTHCIPNSDLEDSQNLACGVCLLSVDPVTMTACSVGDINNGKLTHFGRQYHATCANFWVNCVDQTLPTLTLSNLV